MKRNFELSPGDWEALRELLQTALEMDPASRAEWVDSLGPEKEEFKPRLRALLSHASDSSGAAILDTPPKFEPEPLAVGGELDGRNIGDLVGPYRLLRILGQGGMGNVWLAERDDMLQRRQVALKLPRLMTDRAQLAEQLAREREILAGLNHPNIAHLYDAGVASDGQPYLALEYVEGECIDVYCNHRQLDVSDRLRLFLQVVRAVAHAHASLVVHRDLKPGNMMVTDAGDVRLLDFGIAKLLENGKTRETQFTRMTGRVLTPDYAAPEQITGKAVTTAADIYALGVVLFELLTGGRPYRLKRDSQAALEEAIVQTEVLRPSAAATVTALKKRLRGDLDTIVLKALKKEPAERYTTANALAEDIERYLAHQPVLAQPDKRSYRLRKFVARNRLAVVAASSVLLAILAGASVAVWQAIEARAEQRRAEAVKDFIASIFIDANPYSGSTRELTALDLLRQAEQRLDAATDMAPEYRIELMTLMTEGLSILGGTDAARELAQRTVDDAIANLGARHEQTLRARALYFNVVGPTVDLTAMKEEIEALIRDIRDSSGIPPETLITALIARVDLAYQEGDLQTVEDAAEEAYEIAQRHFPRGHRSTLEAATLLASAYMRNNKDELALRAARNLYEITFEEVRLDPNHATAMDSTIIYGMALSRAGQFDEGLPLIAEAVERAVEVYGDDNQSTAFFRGHLALHQGMAGLVRESAENYRTALASIRKTLGEDNGAYIGGSSRYVPVVLETRDVAMAVDAAEDFHRLLNRQEAVPEALKDQANGFLAVAHAYRGAIPEANDYVGRIGALQGAPHGSFVDLLYVAGVVDRFSGECGRAVQRQRQSLEMLRSGGGSGRQEMHLLTEIGICELELGDLALAESSLTQAIERYRANQPHVTPRQTDALVGLARVHLARAQPEAALPLLSTAEAFWTDFDSSSRWAGMTQNYLAQAYSALGRDEDAERAAARAHAVLAAVSDAPPPP